MAKIVLPEELKEAAREDAARNVVEINPEMAALPPRQRRVIEILFKDPKLSFEEICRLANYSPGSSGMVKRAIGGKLAKTLRENGIWESDIVQCLLRNLEATKVVFIQEKERNYDGKVIGEHTRTLEVPDNSTQLTALKMILMLGDYFPAKKFTGEVTHNVGRTFYGVPIEELESRRKQLEDQGVQAQFEVVEEELDAPAADESQERVA